MSVYRQKPPSAPGTTRYCTNCANMQPADKFVMVSRFRSHCAACEAQRIAGEQEKRKRERCSR